MEEKLMTKAELAAFFQTSARSARAFCEKHGVSPINVGQGKIARLRWRASEVIQMLGTLEAKPCKPAKGIIPRRRGSKTVIGKSADELFRELAAPIQ